MAETVLLVASDRDLLYGLGEKLAVRGYFCLSAREPQQAEEFLADQAPSLIILDDVGRPWDALELVRRWRRDFPWTEIIYLIGPGRRARAARALGLGISDCLMKPVDDGLLEITLERAKERLIARAKLAVLSGEALANLPIRQLDSVLDQIDQGTNSALVLYETQQRFQQLFDVVPCYISVLDQEFHFTALNRRFKDMFGDVAGESCFDVYQGRCEYCPDCPVAQTFVDGQSHQYEQIITGRDGEPYNVLTHTAPIRDASGEISQVMEMSIDITEIRKLQNHLASLGMLIGSISHGVKGLITALDGGMYSLRTGFARGDHERVQRGWEVVELMVGRIRSTVLDVLFYAKDRGVDLEVAEVGPFAHQVALAAEQFCVKHGIAFDPHIAPDLGVFQVDPNALHPALINLLENAVDACLEDQVKDHHQVQFRVWREDDVVVFEVTDDGMGMDEATRQNMFTLFFTSKGSAGTGLGLFIAHDTVSQLGGTITVDSEPGQGSTFHVRIPDRPRPTPPGRALLPKL